MRKIVKTGAAALMLTCMAGNVWAAAATAAGCARPADMSALQTAAKQQRLMVAALSCNAAPLYNDFVRTYQKELQDSDKTLEAYFRRLNGQTGTSDYHAYKTRMANASSIQSIHDITAYCASAKAAFEEALGSAKLTLVAFVSDTVVDDAFAPCQYRTAGSPEQTTPPRAKPVQTVIPAQGSGLATSK